MGSETEASRSLVSELQALRLGPDEALVLKSSKRLSCEQMDNIRKACEGFGRRVLVVDQGFDVAGVVPLDEVKPRGD